MRKQGQRGPRPSTTPRRTAVWPPIGLRLVLVTMLSGCATHSPAPVTPQIPPPPAALQSEQTVTDWLAFSQKLVTWLRSARSAVSGLPIK